MDILIIKQYINYESKLFNFKIFYKQITTKSLIENKNYTFSNRFEPIW